MTMKKFVALRDDSFDERVGEYGHDTLEEALEDTSKTAALDPSKRSITIYKAVKIVKPKLDPVDIEDVE